MQKNCARHLLRSKKYYMSTTEIECRFLEINKDELVQKLLALGAHDEGEKLLEETIIYDAELAWRDEGQHLRLRKAGDTTTLTFKRHTAHTIDGTYELEFSIGDKEKAELLFEQLGFVAYRHQQKKRHSLRLGNDVVFDIDTWPRIPTYVEIEGESEDAIKQAAAAVGFDWSMAELHSPAWIIENIYHIPVRQLRWFTFDRCE